MKLLAWLCIAWRPPGSSTLTHISFIDQPIRSPKRSTPNSINFGVIIDATSTSNGLSPGCSILVCARLADELFSSLARREKCCTRPLVASRGRTCGARKKGVGKRLMTSSMCQAAPAWEVVVLHRLAHLKVTGECETYALAPSAPIVCAQART